VLFVALSLGKKSWKELVAKYPPTKEQKREFQGQTLSWDIEAFPPIAFRRCLRIAEFDEDGNEILSELDDDLIDEMFEEEDGPWNDAEVGSLLFSIQIANESAPRVGDLGNE
jgi:hypothetical protein